MGGAGKTGWDWVITSFRLARKYFPNSKLIMNEYNVINNTAATLNYIKIINLLKADSLIDGIGEQAHAFTTAGTTASTLKSNLDLLAATGVPIYLTEMDIDGPTDLAQLNEYQRVFPVFWQHPGIKGITMWGFRTGLWRNAQGAYLLTNTGVERLAMKWLKGYVNGNLILTQSIGISAPNNADSIFVGDKLKLSAVVLPTNTTIPNITWSVLQSSLATIDLSGNLIAKTAGKVTLNATSWDGSGVIGSYDIVISNRLADSIKVSSIGKRDSIYVGELLQMTAQVMPSNTSNPSYTWSISPSSLATISSNGFVNALAKGKVTVKASSNDGSDVSDSMNITILNRLIQSISLSSATNIDSMLPARTLRVIAQVLPQFATIKTILWSITPDSIASIDSEGLITGIANGKAMVEATSMDGSGVKGNMTIIVSDQTSGIRDRINPDKITVYPNPAIGGSFTVAGIEKIRLIELFDLLGKKIVTFNNINQSSLNIQINLPRGIYILNLSDGQQGFYKKIIIQ